MGDEISRSDFSSEDFKEFRQRLKNRDSHPHELV